jgi:hypothetical protein
MASVELSAGTTSPLVAALRRDAPSALPGDQLGPPAGLIEENVS